MERHKSNYQACRIDLKLATDLVMQTPIRFDALLQYFCIQEDSDNGIFYDAWVDYDLPLRKLAIAGHWFWDVSNAIVVPRKQSLDTLKKKINHEGLTRKTINIGSGKYCSNILTFERQQVESVRFFAYGDFERIKEISYRLQGQRLGALRKNGFGLVAAAEVCTVDMKYCCWDSKTQVLLRDVPFGGTMGMVWGMIQDIGISLRYGRCRPPYYPSYSEESVPLIMEGSKMDLSDKLEVIR